MTSYMRQSSKDSGLWPLKNSAIRDARSNVVLLSARPSLAFAHHSPVPRDPSDVERAPVSTEGMFPEGTLVELRIRAPTVYVEGRRSARAAWQGTKLFEGKVVKQFFYANSRQYSYHVEWAGGIQAERSLADLQDVLDEGVVERLILQRR